MKASSIVSKPQRIGAVIFIIVAVEAFLVLAVLGQGRAALTGGDGPGYHQIALNLLEHFEFSLSKTSPIEPTIYRCPGYPIFIASIYLVSGQSFLGVRAAQFLLLGLTAYLLFRLASCYVDPRTAKLSALLCVTYLPLVFLTTFLLTEMLTTCIAVGLILLLEKKVRSDGGNYLIDFAIGIGAGSLALIRPSFSLSIFPIVTALAIARIGVRIRAGTVSTKTAGIKNELLSLAITASGFVLLLSPWLIRNATLSHKLVVTAADGESLYLSMLQYKGRVSYAFTVDNWQKVYIPELYKREDEVARRLKSVTSDSSSSQSEPPLPIQKQLLLNELWRQGAREEFRQLTFVQIVKSLPKRLAYLWSTCDMSPQWLQAGFFHRLVQGQFGLLFLFTVLGIWFRRKNLLREWPLWIFPVYLMTIHLFFHIEARYSMPARTFLLIYSAVGIVAVFEWIRRQP